MDAEVSQPWKCRLQAVAQRFISQVDLFNGNGEVRTRDHAKASMAPTADDGCRFRLLRITSTILINGDGDH